MENKQILKRMLVWLIGLAVIQVGVALFLNLGLGSDPFTLFTQGIARKLDISQGTANRILTLVFLGTLFGIDRKQIRIGTFLAIIGAGVILDGILKFTAPLHMENYNVWVKMALFMAGCVIICIGFPILKSSELGVAPNDLIYLALVNKLKRSYAMVRISVDSFYMILGIILGGVIGIGTMLCIVLLGPLMDVFFPKVERIVNRFIYVAVNKNENTPNSQI